MYGEVGEVWEWSEMKTYLILAVYAPDPDDVINSPRYDALELRAGRYQNHMAYTIGSDERWKKVV